MTESSIQRDKWNSKAGFIIAAAGSAIGLGNIWRFPYVAGENGGAAFVILYILFVLLIGLPVMIAELTIGRNTQKNPIGAFLKLFPKSSWKYFGVMGVLTGIGILSFYGVIAGYTIGYFVKLLLGQFDTIAGAVESQRIFEEFTANPYVSVGYLFVFLTFTGYIVLGGISAGIEKWAKILMPILFVLLIILAIRSITLDGAIKGLEFYLEPDFSKVTASTFVMALGQALFSLSLGMGAMITYGSYLSKKDNIISSAASVCFFDTLIAILAGLVMFPALFAMGMNPSGGPGLVFIVLPSIFSKFPGGIYFGAGIFLLLSVAALTSTISLLEVAVSYFVDEKKWTRKKATVLMSIFAFICGVPSALSMGSSDWLSDLPILHIGVLELMNAVFGNYSLALGSLLVAIFAGYKWGVKAVKREVHQFGNEFKYFWLWSFLIRFLCPIAISIILGYIIITGNYF